VERVNRLWECVGGRRSAVVTGAAGFIGGHLVHALLRRGVDVIGVDTRSAQDPRCSSMLRSCLANERLRVIQGDLRSVDLEPIVVGSDVVFHLAALTGVRESWGDRFEDYLSVNVSATHRLVQACGQSQVPRIVLASSSSVYGGFRDGPSKEGDPPSPRSPYGVTKLAAEQLAQTLAHHPASTTTVTALRYFSVYGPGQRPDMLISQVLQAALTRRPVRVFGSQDQCRDFTFVDDVVAATICAARIPAVASVVNVGVGRPRSIREVLAVAEHVTGRSVVVEPGPPAAGDVVMTWADTTQAAQVLDCPPVTGLEEGMAATWEWTLERGRANQVAAVGAETFGDVS